MLSCIRIHQRLSLNCGGRGGRNLMANVAPVEQVVRGLSIARAHVVPVRCGERGLEIERALSSNGSRDAGGECGQGLVEEFEHALNV